MSTSRLKADPLREQVTARLKRAGDSGLSVAQLAELCGKSPRVVLVVLKGNSELELVPGDVTRWRLSPNAH